MCFYYYQQTNGVKYVFEKIVKENIPVYSPNTANLLSVP